MPASQSHPTVAALAAMPKASFTFDCRPCGRLKFYHGEELQRFLARVPEGETFVSLKSRMICPKCKKPVDGWSRTFDFSCGTDERGYGWSGPKA